MKVSIITVCFNSAKTIEDTILSVLSQKTVHELQYIVVDGNSTDNTVNLVKKYDGKLKLIVEKDDGMYDAINKGIKIANGEIIGILNSDDVFKSSDTLDQILAEFVNQDISAVIGNCEIYNSFTEGRYKTYRANLFRQWMFRFGFQPPHPSTFFKKQVYDDIGLFDISFVSAGDFEFLLRAIKINKINYKVLDIAIVKMRSGGLSSSGARSYIRTSKEILKALRKHKIYSNIFLVMIRLPIKFFGRYLLK